MSEIKDKNTDKNNSINNLIPASAPGGHKLTVDEQRAGGVASGIARRKKKDFREACLALLESEMTDNEGNFVTGYDVVVSSLFTQAKAGNVKAFEALRDTAGQKPVEKLVVSDVDPSVINEVESIVSNTAASETATDIDDVADAASPLARDDATAFPPPAQVAGVASSNSKPKKRATKKKAQSDVSSDDSPFFDINAGDDDS